MRDPAVLRAARRIETCEKADADQIRSAVVDALYEVSESDGACTYQLRTTEAGDVAVSSGRATGDAERFLTRVLSEPGFRSFVDASAAPKRERRHLLEDTAIWPRHVYEQLSGYQRFLEPLGLHHQQRLLVFHGNRFVAHVGCARGRHAGPYTPRDRRRLQPLVEPVISALVLAERLERASLPEGPAALVVRADGYVDFASAVGKAWLERPAFVAALKSHVRAFDREEEPPPSALLERAEARCLRLDGADGVRYLVEVLPAREVTVAESALLSPRQREIAELAAAGATLAEIGASLGVSPETAKSHLSEVYRRLGVSSRVELARALSERG